MPEYKPKFDVSSAGSVAIDELSKQVGDSPANIVRTALRNMAQQYRLNDAAKALDDPHAIIDINEDLRVAPEPDEPAPEDPPEETKKSRHKTH
ncbi:hypothetical protein [Planctomicrobium piriforme]|uniref:Uncharacterized protein n=1 Tax=Planctomicrobium piriforme TaxID=1576369 RepID=A0A1I3EFP1_9PLAN|nr:hypothetical protein [Planctomicrobium piriforme]SFH97734.1 hypothetical protein SAMN05421753_104201 [Planctomicrobium piriforme]